MPRTAQALVVLSILLLGCSRPRVENGTSLDTGLPIHPLDLPRGVEIEGVTVTRVDPAHVSVVVEILNATQDTLEFMRGQCFARLRAYATKALEEPAIWYDERRHLTYCPDLGYVHRLRPAEGDTLRYEIDVGSFASWPPPRGSHLGVVLLVNGQRMVGPAHQVWTP